jgi:hypothetical protein
MTTAQHCSICGVGYGFPDRPAYHDGRECEWMQKLTEDEKRKLWDVHRIDFHKTSERQPT